MKNYKTLLLVLFGYFTTAQTIEISEKYNTQLVFPDNVVTKTLGGDDSLFAYLQDENHNPRIVGLKYFGTGATETNLQVITQSGAIYDLKLIYKKEPLRRTYVVRDEDKIHSLILDGSAPAQDKIYSSYSVKSLPKVASNDIINSNTIIPIAVSKQQLNKPQLVANTANSEAKVYDETDAFYSLGKKVAVEYGENYFDFVRNKASKFKKKKPQYFLPRNKYNKKDFRIKMRLKGIYRSKNEVYISVLVHNTSNNPYEISSMQLLIDSNPNSKYTIDQPIQLQPVLTEGIVKQIGGGRKMEFVMAISKLTLENNKILRLLIDEENGERALELSISADNLNNPLRS